MFSGWNETPDVPFDHHLLVAEAHAKIADAVAKTMTWGTSAGLDKTAEKRGLLVLRPGALKASMFGIDGLRVFKPITPRITK